MSKNNEKRPIDKITSDVYGMWGKAYTLVSKSKVRFWKILLIVAFLAGSAVSIVMLISFNMQSLSKASEEGKFMVDLSNIAITHKATGSETFSTATVPNDGQAFKVEVLFSAAPTADETKNIVAAKAVVLYNAEDFTFDTTHGIDTSESLFNADNTCVYLGAPCKITSNEVSTDGKLGTISITMAKPTPGVSNEVLSENLASLWFIPKRVVTPTDPNISIQYLPDGENGPYADSDLIINDGQGTDILTGVYDAKITVGAPFKGTVSGLMGTLVLKDNSPSITNAESLTIAENGNFSFTRALASGSEYAVSIETQPDGQTCDITNGSGTISTGTATTNIQIVCHDSNATAYNFGVTVSGLNGTLVLIDSSPSGSTGETLTITQNGTYAFARTLSNGNLYAVSIQSKPAAQTCTMTGDAGMVNGAGIDVKVNCTSTYSCQGTPPNGTTQIMCPDDDKDVPVGNLFWLNNGTENCTSVRKCEYRTPAAATYSIGGSISGLVNPTGTGKNLTIQLDSGNPVTVTSNTYSFSGLSNGTYTLSIDNPDGQICHFNSNSASGRDVVINNGSVNNANITCANVQRSCIGNAPANATLCSEDGTVTGTSDVQRTLPANGCDNPNVIKCQYSCNNGYNYSNGSCVAQTYTCGGSYGSGTPCSNNGTVRANESWTLVTDCNAVSTGTPSNCRYTAPLPPPVTTCTGYDYNDWGDCKNGKQTRSYDAIPLGCTGGSLSAPVTEQSCSEKKKKTDKTKPKFDAMPSFLNKRRGEKIWWKAKDNKGVSKYTYRINGVTTKTKATSFNVPLNMKSGLYTLKITAYDKAGNTKSKYVVIRVR